MTTQIALGDIVCWQGTVGRVISHRRWSIYGYIVDVKLANGLVAPIAEHALGRAPDVVVILPGRGRMARQDNSPKGAA